ncbi:membrane integrity-associated transporter subunit PqiC [Dyella dinghuensis]|uniref:Membrane integrity-associated transporter subunit PqiC n=1 Tax=Dyella dinghuensis TaxID=1920169 RepID=A0A3S0QYC5_9GAMM|nr:ABC-type transport auxiliary lipoprotein family protein [Dyella dinghuensis]RUL65839.1 membrane integrity-associated transporter subunit PqiC [Dyella dinghuensis]
MKRYTLVIAVALLAGCASTDLRYHTLQPAIGHPEMSASKFRARLTSVQIPAEVDTEQLVVRANGNTLIRESEDRWAAPLADEIRGALDNAWRQDYGLEDVQGVDDASRSIPHVGVQIQKLDAAVGSHVELVANWWVSLDQAQAAKSWSCQRVYFEHAEGGIDDLVDAQQRVFRSLAGDMALSAVAMESGHVPVCPDH